MTRLTLADLERMESDLMRTCVDDYVSIADYIQTQLLIDQAKIYVSDDVCITEEDFDKAWIKTVSTGDILDCAALKKELGI